MADTTEKIIPFYGNDSPFSNWSRHSFVVDNIKYVSMEQYMMCEKAVLFGDDDVARRIMRVDAAQWSTLQGMIKQLGREVRNFDEAIWEANREDIVFTGLAAKFTQNVDAKEALLATGDATLVEASPRDRIWGVGVGAEKALNRKNWRGLNLLGKCLMRVRTHIMDLEHT